MNQSLSVKYNPCYHCARTPDSFTSFHPSVIDYLIRNSMFLHERLTPFRDGNLIQFSDCSYLPKFMDCAFICSSTCLIVYAHWSHYCLHYNIILGHISLHLESESFRKFLFRHLMHALDFCTTTCLFVCFVMHSQTKVKSYIWLRLAQDLNVFQV